MYSDMVKEHFRNPRNVGEIDDADVILQVGEPSCGDVLLLFLKIDRGIITNVKYRIFGCGAAIATSSIASELALGKPLDEVLKLTDQDIADALGGLPEDKMHCSVLAVTALHTGIMRYLAATGEIGQ
ncbi:MAG: iron-sulfur cluster assembly scaffold protein [Geobacteraceae bacterium]|nr:iron-sulfur cluster assembly scaffold protein [Geobacteraceae bacterium]